MADTSMKRENVYTDTETHREYHEKVQAEARWWRAKDATIAMPREK